MQIFEKNPTIQFILESISQFKWWMIPLCMISMFWAFDVSFRPYLLKIIIDKLPTLSKDDIVSGTVATAALYVLLTFLIVLLFRFYDYMWSIVNPGLKKYIGDRLMSRMMNHSHSLFQNNFAGALGNRIKDVMSSVPDLLKLGIDSFLSHTLALLIAIFTFTTVNYQFAIALAIWTSVFFVGSFILSKKASYLSHLASEVRSTVVGKIVDILSNMVNVRLFGARQFESQRLIDTLDQYVLADRRRDRYFMFVYAFQGFSFFIYETFCIVGLIYGYKNDLITSGDFILILTLNNSLVDSLWSLSEDIGKFAEYYGNIEQGLKISMSPIEILDDPNHIKTSEIDDYTIRFENVLFHYKFDTPIFKNKSIVIPSGEKVGLVGYSGSGKSTFVNLILRLHDVTDGVISIGGHNICNIPQDDLRNMIGMIPQDPSLFHRGLMDNIRYGRNNASDEEVILAAKCAHAHDFISALPEGYNSMAGERGIKLSGGQRQRIAIARAILKNAPILILDEATSQLDSITEKYIQKALHDLMTNKTTIVIAHRLSTLLNMDRILVFDKGQIIEDGSHKELLQARGLYHQLWNSQVGGFLPDYA